jgi:hypothetical protein
MAAGAVLAAGTRNASKSETRQNLAHRAQQEVERIASLSYETIAHTASPSAGSANVKSPLYWYSTSTGKYRWDRGAAGATTAEPLVVDAEGVVEVERTWTDGAASGKLFAFVTWVTDPRCGTGCPSSQNYKRVTVAATLTSGAGTADPVFVSSIVSDPQALPAGKIVNGNANPLADPNITCKDASGNTVACTASVGATNINEWYLSDSPATAAYAAPTASHTTHPTIAPSGTCTTAVTTGCPKPDLLSTEAPPAPAEGQASPPLLDYSAEQTGLVHPGGRVLVRDTECSATPSSVDNAKGAFWVTAPLASATALTGAGGMTLHTQTVAGAVAGVTLCVAVYDVGNALTNLVANPPTRLGVVAFTVAEWPAAPTPLSFSFDFVTGGTIRVAAGHRIGVRLWAAGSSAADLVLLYDHPDRSSVLQLNSL